jgi:hypothetical protein
MDCGIEALLMDFGGDGRSKPLSVACDWYSFVQSHCRSSRMRRQSATKFPNQTFDMRTEIDHINLIRDHRRTDQSLND